MAVVRRRRARAAARAWVLSLPLRDVSIVDVAWGLAFVDIAWVSARLADGDGGRTALAVALVTVWGLRLALYIALPQAQAPRRGPALHEDARARPRPLRRSSACSRSSCSRPSSPGSSRCRCRAPRRRRTPPRPARLPRRRPVAGRLRLRGRRRPPARSASRPTPRTRARSWTAASGATRATRTTSATSRSGGASTSSRSTAARGGRSLGPLIMTVLLTRVSGKDLLEKSMSSSAPATASTSSARPASSRCRPVSS